jgi:hypothetical protein
MNQPIDVITHHSPCDWQHIPTGEIHSIVWASPREVITVSMSCTWRGRAVEFVREFAKI